MMKNFTDFLKKKLEDPNFSKEYNRIDPFFQLAKEMIRLRNKRGITQKELALRIGSTQAVISRIESGSVNCSVSTIQKIAEALEAKLTIQIDANEVVGILEEKIVEPSVFGFTYPEDTRMNELAMTKYYLDIANSYLPHQFEVWSIKIDSKKKQSICNS